MKFLFLLVGISSVLSIACSSGTKGNISPQGQVESSTSVPPSVQAKPTATVESDGTETCPSTGTSTAVGKTPKEAVINSICYNGNGNSYVFKKIDLQENVNNDGSKAYQANVVVDQVNCSDCPHEYEGAYQVSLNFNQDWQANVFKNLIETEQSQIDSHQRMVSATSTAYNKQFADVKIKSVAATGTVIQVPFENGWAAAVKMDIDWPPGLIYGHPIMIKIQLKSGEVASVASIPLNWRDSFNAQEGYEYFDIFASRFSDTDIPNPFKVLAYCLGYEDSSCVKVN